MYDILTRLGKAEHKKGWFSGILQEMTGSLSPRPENSTRRIRGGFNFLFGTCGFKRQTVVCRGSNLSLGRQKLSHKRRFNWDIKS